MARPQRAHDPSAPMWTPAVRSRTGLDGQPDQTGNHDAIPTRTGMGSATADATVVAAAARMGPARTITATPGTAEAPMVASSVGPPNRHRRDCRVAHRRRHRRCIHVEHHEVSCQSGAGHYHGVSSTLNGHTDRHRRGTHSHQRAHDRSAHDSNASASNRRDVQRWHLCGRH
jgi:hypothetical protein